MVPALAAHAIVAVTVPSRPSFATERSGDAPTGIIILGGTLNHFIDGAGSNQTVPPDPRTAAGVALAARYPNARVYYAGREDAPGPVPWLLAAGIDRERITWESRSRTTAENARFALPILHPRPDQLWLLVTSDSHMLRAAICFRRAGFRLETHPVTNQPEVWTSWVRRLLHESIGLVYYVATGRCAPDFSA